MAKQFLGTRYQSFKLDGTVNASGTVYFYEPGTSTAKATYSDSALTTANANPVVLDSAGAADIWYDGNADVSVYDSTATLVDSYSSINPATSSSIVESNLIANGSFEEGTSTVPLSWTRTTPPTGGTSAQDLDSAHGLYSWKFTSVGNGAGSLTTTDFLNVAVGRAFNVVWLMKSSVADVRNLVEVVWYDDADAEISTSSAYDDSATNPTTWTVKSYAAIPVSTAVRAKLRLTGCHSSDATAGSTWFDGVLAYEGVNTSADNTFTGNNTLSGTTTQSGLLSLTSGQLKFPAGQSASSNVNTLDDYEEGQWTPAVGGTAVYTGQTGYYTKIGNMVFIQCLLVINTIGTGSTTIISGLPFVCGGLSAGACQWQNAATAITSLTALTGSGVTTVTLYSSTAAATSQTTASAIFGDGTVVYFTLQYRV